jgi:hypothetical protein
MQHCGDATSALAVDPLVAMTERAMSTFFDGHVLAWHYSATKGVTAMRMNQVSSPESGVPPTEL